MELIFLQASLYNSLLLNILLLLNISTTFVDTYVL